MVTKSKEAMAELGTSIVTEAGSRSATSVNYYVKYILTLQIKSRYSAIVYNRNFRYRSVRSATPSSKTLGPPLNRKVLAEV